MRPGAAPVPVRLQEGLGWPRRGLLVTVPPLCPPPPCPQELRLFLTTEGELGDSAAWVALGKGAAQGAAAAAGGAAGAGAGAGGGGGLLDGTARLSKQLLGLDRGVTDPVQVGGCGVVVGVLVEQTGTRFCDCATEHVGVCARASWWCGWMVSGQRNSCWRWNRASPTPWRWARVRGQACMEL